MTDIEETERKFPEQIKLKSKGKRKNCSHKNIAWNDFFKGFQEKTEEPYCLDCGEDENAEFTKEFQRWYCKKINEWLVNKGTNKYNFASFLAKKDYLDNWQDLQRGKFFDNIKDELSVFQEMSGYIEDYCLEFYKEKGVKVDNNFNPNKNKSQAIKREQIQQEIRDLENKPNKTAEEEQELTDKRQQLADLEANTNTKEPFYKNPVVIGGGVFLVVMALAVYCYKKKRVKK